jgi:hypothetical protein
VHHFFFHYKINGKIIDRSKPAMIFNDVIIAKLEIANHKVIKPWLAILDF